MPPAAYLKGADITRLLQAVGSLSVPDDPTTYRAYYRELYRRLLFDREGVQQARAAFDYPLTADRFQMIEPTYPLVVSYGSEQVRFQVQQIIAGLREGRLKPTRNLMRRLHPYLVNLTRHDADQYITAGLIQPVTPDLALGEWRGEYDQRLGLTLPNKRGRSNDVPLFTT